MHNIFHKRRHHLIGRNRKLRFSQRHARGQALVELALSVTFLAMLFSAAVDLGFAYKSYQTLLNATAEASSYLVVSPAASCTDPSNPCDPQVLMDAADSIARTRFRGEQGNKLRSFGGSTMDLNADNKDDQTTTPAGFSSFDQFIKAKVQIDEADSSQITVNDSNFAVGSSFDPSATDEYCQRREKFDSTGGQCFIVVRAEIVYKPFFIGPAIGKQMTIRALSVKPIVRNS